MKNFEKVEAYFNNELNDSEKNDLLSEVESNAELKSEYNFQNEVINGIKEARKAELKAMLNNVPIASVSTTTTGMYKFLIGGAATLILGTALWYYFNATTNLEDTDNNEIVDSAPLKDENSNAVNKIVELNNESETIKSTNETIELISKEENKKDSPTINTPVVPNSEDGFTNQSLAEENLEIPKDISKADINLSSKVDVEIKLNKKYNFHYQYLQGKLVLYGNFEEGLFEVLELNKENTIEIYLYFKSNYYYIKDKSGDIIPLKEINNKSLKLKLERIR